METIANLRLRADRLRTFLQTHGLKVNKAIALEAQAAQVAVRDWNTLSALAKKAGATPKVGSVANLEVANPNFGYEHLASCIGGNLPSKYSAGLKDEIDQIRHAIAICGWPDKWMLEVQARNNGWFQCPQCEKSINKLIRSENGEFATEIVCPGCALVTDLAVGIVIPRMLTRKDMFLEIRRDLSQASIPILGYESLDNTVSTAIPNGPLVFSCRSMAESFSYAVDLAYYEFGIHEVTRETARLGYYISPEEVASSLNARGVSERQAKDLGWLETFKFSGDNLPGRPITPNGLVVAFLPDPKGGPMSFWGYCPKAMRPSQDGTPLPAYLVGKNYSQDAVFLGHLIDARPLLLVSGFMHAIALRQAGINAVAVPSFRGMSNKAIRKILSGRSFIVVSGYDIQSNSTFELEALAEGLRVECLFMHPLGDYEGIEGFATDRFVEDFRTLVADVRTLSSKKPGLKVSRGEQNSNAQISSVLELAIEKFLVQSGFDHAVPIGWTQDALEYVVVPLKRIRMAISQFVPVEVNRQLRLNAVVGDTDHPARGLLIESLNRLKLLITELQGDYSESCLWDVSMGVDYFAGCALFDKRRIAEVRPDIVPKWGITQHRITVRKPTLLERACAAI